jgi:hypothetical protein
MRKTFFYCLLLIAMASCKEKYTPNIDAATTSFLVVEGFINSGASPTTITLTRTTKIVDTIDVLREQKANVKIEAKNPFASYQLTETAAGIYTSASLALNTNNQYRIHIFTSNGKEYVSDYSDVRATPDIDSVFWNRKDGGVQTYVATHDPLNKTRYYYYKFDETWEYHSKYTNSLKFYLDTNNKPYIGFRDSMTYGPDTTIIKCWKTNSSSNIYLTSSEKLSQDIVTNYPLAYIEPNSWKLSILYSINVKQYAVSKNGYDFLQQLRKNTEQLGSIFDAQPSDNYGNIHCITNPNETVVGFVEVSQEKQKRIFISSAQVPDWKYNPGCEPEVKVLNNRDSLGAYKGGLMLTNVAEYGGPSGILYVFFAQPECIDCKKRGGANSKPPFWP